MKILTQLLITALYTIFVQNIVMTSGLGMSEVMRISPRPRTFAKFAVMISGFSVVTSVLCYFITSKTTSIDSYAAKAVVYGAVLG